MADVQVKNLNSNNRFGENIKFIIDWLCLPSPPVTCSWCVHNIREEKDGKRLDPSCEVKFFLPLHVHDLCLYLI